MSRFIHNTRFMNLVSTNGYIFKVFLKTENNGGYTVFVPSLPGCITYGDTSEQAIENAHEAILGYIESRSKHGEAIIDDSNILEYTISIPHNAQVTA